ncbi:zinc-binding protein A33-like isoform X2 [Clupea harengus]|nr:zinc-binding protein A33-like isoform X2 [Clupea harengus]
MVEKMLIYDGSSAEGTGSATYHQFSSKMADLSVSSDFLSLGPYETHLLFFVWKDILRNIQPVPHDDVIDLWDKSYAKVACSGRSIKRADRKGLFGLYRDYRPLAMGRGQFWAGQNYWEVEVGRKLDWGVGVCVEESDDKLQEQVMMYLKHGRGYSVVAGVQETPLNLPSRPWRVGVYLDCDEGQVSFYDADSLILFHTAECGKVEPFYLCLSPGTHLDGGDDDSLSVQLSFPTVHQ